jgi:DNA-binding transcriptional MerR regulator
MHRNRIITFGLVLAILAVPVGAAAQEGGLTVDVSSACGVAFFDISSSAGIPPYQLAVEFGDGESETADGVALPTTVDHDYAAGGTYDWSVGLLDSADPAMEQTAGGSVVLGPQVSLTSDPFPPLLTLENGEATITFTATADGGDPPYSYAWDPDGDGVFDAGSNQASMTYTAGGKYQAAVQVTDDCGVTTTATLAVVVIDPEAEACHPMAQRIADGVNALFPLQAGQLYTCDDIFSIFRGALTGNTLGFGRMWHAVQLAQTMPDLTWEEILQWQLDGSGWGLLLQLDRFSKALDEVGLRELFDMVVAGDATVGEVRTAVRAATRYGADFGEALARVQAGANPGELTQFYRTADELGLTPAEMDAYLEQGLSIPELRHAGRVALQDGADLASITAAREDGFSWGEIQQAVRLAGDGGDVNGILQDGVRETRQSQREDQQQEREQDRLQRQAEQNLRIATRLAQQYGVSVEQVQALAEGSCGGDWGCVQATLRQTYAPSRGSNRGGKK